MFKFINDNLVDSAFILDVEFSDDTHVHYILPNSLVFSSDDIEDSRRGLRYIRDNYDDVICLSDEKIDTVVSCRSWSIGNSIEY